MIWTSIGARGRQDWVSPRPLQRNNAPLFPDLNQLVNAGIDELTMFKLNL